VESYHKDQKSNKSSFYFDPAAPPAPDKGDAEVHLEVRKYTTRANIF
jgi:hypothetical protein